LGPKKTKPSFPTYLRFGSHEPPKNLHFTKSKNMLKKVGYFGARPFSKHRKWFYKTIFINFWNWRPKNSIFKNINTSEMFFKVFRPPKIVLEIMCPS